MSAKSAIEWTDSTWNPTTGCTKVSEGCRHCYIDRTPPFRIGHRSFDKGEEIGATTGVLLHEDRLDQPLHWRKPRRVFVNSLSDLFHDDVPDEFIARVFQTMSTAQRHVFQVLTKRPRRMKSFLDRCGPVWFEGDNREGTTWITHNGAPPSSYGGDGILVGVSERWPLSNVWLGTSVEDQKAADLRIPLLLDTPAAVRFLSCEPLLGPVDLGLTRADEVTDRGQRLHWVIVGGESGPKARPMHPQWARELRDQCVSAGAPFFFKQWGEWSADPSSKPKPDAMVLDDGRVIGPHEEVWLVETLDAVPMAKVGKKHSGRDLDGRTWDEMPEAVSA